MSRHRRPRPPRRWSTARKRITRWFTQWMRWWRTDDGAASAFVIVLTTGILILAGLALDGGLALAAKVRAHGHAEAAARAGAQALDLTAYRATGALRLAPAQAITAARAHLAAVGATGSVTITGDAITVTVTTAHPTQLLGVVGIDTLAVHGTGTAQPTHDIPET